MFSLLIREKVGATVSSESGIILILFEAVHRRSTARLFVWCNHRAVCSKPDRSQVLGRWGHGHCEYYYPGGDPRNLGGWRLRDRCGIAEGVHEEALEESFLPPISSYDLGEWLACSFACRCSYIMLQGWLVSAGLIFALIPGLSFLSSLAVAACLTPTDPILAAAVVGGKYADKHVPAHLRHLLAAESGCNDGAAFPFLYIALYLITESSDRHAVQDWFLITWLCEYSFGL